MRPLGGAHFAGQPSVRRAAFQAVAIASQRIAAVLAARTWIARRLRRAFAFLALALHLFLQALRALAQGFERTPLMLDGAALAFAVCFQIALGFAHGAFGVVEPLLAFKSLALHPPLQLGEPVAQRLLTLVERRAAVGLPLRGIGVVLRLAVVGLF